MKKLIAAVLAAATCTACAVSMSACGSADAIYVDTNAYFAPFEYYGGADGTTIMGVDVDIMNMVGKKLGKKVKFENTDFDVIINNVESGAKYDCGAAGITVTEARQKQVAFSKTYYTSVQYVIYSGNTFTPSGTSTDGEDVEYILWSQLAGKKIGVQRDTTGDIYVNDEINGYKDDDGNLVGELLNKNSECIPYDNAQLAVDAIAANGVDVVVVDQLPAEYIVAKNKNLHCYALYYDAETATSEEYAIAVNKNNTTLLKAINDVLDQLGEEGIATLVAYHFLVS